MKILVTGSAGVLGSRVARGLVDKYELRTTDILLTDSPGEFIQADLTDYAQASDLIKGCDIVVHCAAIHPWKQYRCNNTYRHNYKYHF